MLLKLLPSPSQVWFGLFAFGIYVFSQFHIKEIQDQARILIPPPKGIQYFTFGLKEQLGDALWIRSIQDFDYCEEKIDRNCTNKGWLWQMLDLVTDLSPSFRIVYATGPMALSVIVSDIEGASLLFDKAVKNFPTDWSILYRAAYHAIYEENKPTKAAELLIRAAKNGAPPFAYSLAGKLYAEEGKIELAQSIIADLETQGLHQDLVERIKKRIEEKQKKSGP